MSNILIQNRGELPLWGMRLLGLSNKTSTQIGQFGTGLKESIAFLSRIDALPVVYSGTCRIDFSIQSVCEQDEICFKLSEQQDSFEADRWHGLGMHPHFGKADWDDPWMIFREILCNALDESGTKNLVHDVHSQPPEGVAGATRFYIPVTPELLAAYATVQEKLLALSDPVLVETMSSKDTVLEKRKQKKLQIFHRGVWVQEGDEPSMYDYNIPGLKLNESRSADWYYVHLEMAKILASFTTEMAGKFIGAVLGEGEHFYEMSVLTYAKDRVSVDGPGTGWLEAFHKIYGDDAVVCHNDKFFHERLEQMGRKSVVVKHDGLRNMLKACGVPNATEVISKDKQDYEVLENAAPELQKTFEEIWIHFEIAKLTRGKNRPPLLQFRLRPGSATIVMGAYKNGTCYINLDIAGTIHERLACIEEISHHITEAGDMTREFQGFLIEALGVCMSTPETIG